MSLGCGPEFRLHPLSVRSFVSVLMIELTCRNKIVCQNRLIYRRGARRHGPSAKSGVVRGGSTGARYARVS
jgi:hypothetical protein